MPLYAWGCGWDGRLGLEDAETRGSPTPVNLDILGEQVTSAAVSCGWAHTAALTSSGVVLCWGLGESGQLGLGEEEQNEHGTPQPVKALSDHTITAVACGFGHTLARSDSGIVWSWGKGEHGQLGIGEAGVAASPTLVDGFDAPVTSFSYTR